MNRPRATSTNRRFFYIRSMAKPYGRAVREGASPAGSYARFVNPHGLVHPLDNGEARLKALHRSLP
jgi:hypothetical protein